MKGKAGVNSNYPPNYHDAWNLIVASSGELEEVVRKTAYDVLLFDMITSNDVDTRGKAKELNDIIFYSIFFLN